MMSERGWMLMLQSCNHSTNQSRVGITYTSTVLSINVVAWNHIHGVHWHGNTTNQPIAYCRIALNNNNNN